MLTTLIIQPHGRLAFNVQCPLAYDGTAGSQHVKKCMHVAKENYSSLDIYLITEQMEAMRSDGRVAKWWTAVGKFGCYLPVIRSKLFFL